MSIKLVLKNRKLENSIELRTTQLEFIFHEKEERAKDRLFEMMKGFVQNEGGMVHDRYWLEQIINYMPMERLPDGSERPKQIPLTEHAKWFRLAEKVSAIDDSDDIELELTSFQANLLWERLASPEFVVGNLPIQFIQFIFDLQDAYGQQFPNVEKEGC